MLGETIMKRFFSIVCTFFAAIQSFVFWVIFIKYLIAFNEFEFVLNHIGFWIISFIVLFIIALFDKWVRGLKGVGVIFLDALLSPVRFVTQLLSTIQCFNGKEDIKRGGYYPTRFKNTFYFVLFSTDVSDPSDRVSRSYHSSSSFNSSYSSHSSPSSSSSSSSSSYYPDSSSYEEKKPEKIYGYFAVTREMEQIAYRHNTSVFSTSRAEARIEINVRISGGNICFSCNVKTNYLEWIKSRVEYDDFKKDISNELSSIQSSIYSDAKDWFDSHSVDRDYSISFR